MSIVDHSKEFFELIRQIGETRSKQEEDKIILRELVALKQHMSNQKSTLRMMKEYVVRMLYCEMLGHEASFGYINAIKLSSSKKLLEKKVGYLAVTLCIPKEHELLLLIISNLQKDLQSNNFVEVCAALSAAAKIVNEDTIPAILPNLEKLRKHTMATVRKKTVMLVHTFHTISPGSVPNLVEIAKEALCDRNPSVMGASLCLFQEILKDESMVQEMKELTPSFTSILKQVVENRLPRDFDYHRLPAPWIQIKLLQILAALGKDDTHTSEQMYSLLREVMQRADTGLNIGHAVVFEAVRTVTTILPSNALLEQAANAISHLITSASHNLKYLGIQSLASIVKINPKFASQHQMIVIDCLESQDDTLKRITLDLLYTMTNPNNVVVIVKQLVQFTKTSALGDNALRKTLIHRITDLAEKFAPNLQWYIDTLNQLFFIDAAYIPEKAIADMITVISEGEGEGSEEDEELRLYCVERFHDILSTEDVISDKHLQVICWVLGEYGYLAQEKISAEDIIEILCDRCERQLDFVETRCWIVSALMKLCSQCVDETPEIVMDLLQKYKNSRNVSLQQRCNEFLVMTKYSIATMEDMLPKDGSCEEIEIDPHLSFVDNYVQQARNMGARDYLTNTSELSHSVPKFERTSLVLEHKKTPEELAALAPMHYHANTAVDTPTSSAPTSSSVDVSVPGQSHYPSAVTNESGGLNPSLLAQKKMTWVDSDDEDKMQEQQGHNAQVRQNDSFMSPQFTGPNTNQGVSLQDSNVQEDDKITSFSVSHRAEEQGPEKKITKESKKLMDGIFGGSDAKPNTRSKRNRRSKNAKTEKSRAGNVEEDDLLADGHSTDDSHSPKQQTTANNLANELDNLLDLGDDANLPASGPQQLSSTNHRNGQSEQDSGSLLDDDIFGDMSYAPSPSTSNNVSSNGTAVAASAAATTTTSSIDDLFASPAQTTTATSASASNSQIPNVSSRDDASSAMYPGMLATQLLSNTSNFTVKNVQPILLTQDENLKIQYHKLYDVNGDLLIVLLVESTRGIAMTNIVFQFQAPEKFSMEEIQTDHPHGTVNKGSLSLSQCDPGMPVTVAVRLRLSAIGFGNQLMGTVRYTDSEKIVKLCSANVQITVADVLRAPSDNISVPQFGGQWPKHAHEKRVRINGNWTIDSFTSRALSDLNIKTVQVKGSEVIGFAKFMQQMVLTHAMVTKDMFTFTVRSRDMSLSESIGRLATELWK